MKNHNTSVTLTQTRIREIQHAYLLLAPTLLVLLLVIVYPFITSIQITFTDKTLGAQGKFLGLQNYLKLIKDSQFRFAFVNSFSYTFYCVLIKLVIGIITALLLNQAFRGKGIVRAIIILPWAVSPFISALTWRWIFDDMSGVLNLILKKFSLISDAIYWLSDPNLAMKSIIIASIWQGYPFYTMMILAGLVTIPHELYEASAIDGASAFRQFLHITLPGLKNVLLITVMLSTIWTFNNFQYVYTLTRGGPAGLTHILATLTFKYGIEQRNISLGATVSVMAIPIFVVLSVYLTRIMLKKEAI